MVYINTCSSCIRDDLLKLKSGESILLSGCVYTARDAAHKRMFMAIDKGEALPFPIKDSFIYYAGPTAARPGTVIGSCGPTTSSRMDLYTPDLYKMGLAATIGKGERSIDIAQACKKYKTVYLCAIGGAGALAASSVVSNEVIAFDDLGCESIKKLEFENFPLIVGIDTNGSSIFDKRYKIS